MTFSSEKASRSENETPPRKIAAGLFCTRPDDGGRWQRSLSKKLNKHYGSLLPPVKDVDLEIAEKEFVGPRRSVRAAASRRRCA